ncbi:hypothetical protein [Thermosulfurimonas sp. F29]|uniref:hypothetical protein n=1 Tax=Thermosulfurimonas sp. F29 TaxID=2867247 RepID=UPI001C83F950|nr:hypothetical protein [Thermosulfurimonas sp. F29]MBX6422659.1 hypothetical protein [Thermosulfurimonas sp. F29]
MEEIFLENGLVAYWIAKLSIICRPRIELRLREIFEAFDYHSQNWVNLLLSYFDKDALEFLVEKKNIPASAKSEYFFDQLYKLLPKIENKAEISDPILKKNLEIFSKARFR